ARAPLSACASTALASCLLCAARREVPSNLPALLCVVRPPTTPPLFPYTTLFRSHRIVIMRRGLIGRRDPLVAAGERGRGVAVMRSEEHTSELQSPFELLCRLLVDENDLSRDAPILLRCMGRTEVLVIRPAWCGGG